MFCKSGKNDFFTTRKNSILSEWRLLWHLNCANELGGFVAVCNHCQPPTAECDERTIFAFLPVFSFLLFCLLLFALLFTGTRVQFSFTFSRFHVFTFSLVFFHSHKCFLGVFQRSEVSHKKGDNIIYYHCDQFP